MKLSPATLFMLFLQSFLFAQVNQTQECFLVMAGKNATSDGSVLVAHNNDLTGVETSLLEIIPKTEYQDTIIFPSGLEIPSQKNLSDMLMVKIYSGFAEGDAIAINEFGVSIAGGVALGMDRDTTVAKLDTLVTEGLTGGIRYEVLKASKSAKECVEKLGELYTKYGVTYPSGVAISDSSDVWYIEAGGGRMWAAVRVPDSTVMVVANGYRIETIDLADSNNFIYSPNLIGFCLQHSLMDSNSTTINFAKIFGKSRTDRYYDTRRVWRGLSLIDPDLNLDSQSTEFLMFVTPRKKVSIESLMNILRDQYEGTEFSPDSGASERAIATENMVHSEIVQHKPNTPSEVGSILWCALGQSNYSVYLPFYSGINSIVKEFVIGGEYPDDRSAFWAIKNFVDVYKRIPSQFQNKLFSAIRKFEARVMVTQPKVLSNFIRMYGADKYQAGEYLTKYLREICKNHINLYKTLTNEASLLLN